MISIHNLIHPGMRAAFYGRYSTDKQDMELQRTSVYQFISEFKCCVTVEYCDENVSSVKKRAKDREQLVKLMDDAINKKFDFIAVYKEDRLARDPLEHEWIRQTMRTADIPIVVTSTKTVYDEPDLLMRLLKDGISAYEAAQIRERTRDGLASLIRRGRWAGGQPPFGYTYNKYTGKFEKVPEELVIVKEIYELYLSGVGCHKIAKDHLTNYLHRGKPWTRHSVEAIIQNPFYAGFLKWGQRDNQTKKKKSVSLESQDDSLLIVKSQFIEPIVSAEVWNRCWKLFNQRKEGTYDPHFFQTQFLLRGLIACGNCGPSHKLTCKNQTTKGNNGKTYGKRVYFCTNCKTNKIHADELDEIIKLQVRNKLSLTDHVTLQAIIEKNSEIIKEISIAKDQIFEQKQKYVNQQSIIYENIKRLLRKEQNEHNIKLAKVLTMYRIELNNKIEQIELQIDKMNAESSQIKKIENNAEYWKPLIQLLDKSFEQVTNTEWRQLISSMVSEIRIFTDGRYDVVFNYDIGQFRFNINDNVAMTIFNL